MKYRSLHGHSTGLGLRRLCAVDDGEEAHVDDDTALEQYMEPFVPVMELPASLAEVEAIKSIRFEPETQCDAQADLYQPSDGSTETRLRPEVKHWLQHSKGFRLHPSCR